MSGTNGHHGYRSWLPKGRFQTPFRTRTAFSLAELMVAIGILGVGIVIIAGAFPVAIDQSREAIELSTSQMVFNEAVSQLQTRFTWPELEGLMNPDTIHSYNIPNFSGPNYRQEVLVVEDPTQVPPANADWFLHPQVLADSQYPSRYRATKTYQDPTNNNADTPIFAYTADKTYGWLATVQKVPDKSKCYLFTVFVLREPTGVLTPNLDFKFTFRHLRRNNATEDFSIPLNSRNNMLRFNLNAVPADEVPPRGTIFLTRLLITNVPQLYRITESGETYTADGHLCQNVICDRQVYVVPNPTPPPPYLLFHAMAFPAVNDALAPRPQVTRKVPTVAVYHAILSY